MYNPRHDLSTSIAVGRIKQLLNTQAAHAYHAYMKERSSYRFERRYLPNEARVKDVRDLFPELELEDFELMIETMKDGGLIHKEECNSYYFNLKTLSFIYDRYE